MNPTKLKILNVLNRSGDGVTREALEVIVGKLDVHPGQLRRDGLISGDGTAVSPYYITESGRDALEAAIERAGALGSTVTMGPVVQPGPMLTPGDKRQEFTRLVSHLIDAINRAACAVRDLEVPAAVTLTLKVVREQGYVDVHAVLKDKTPQESDGAKKMLEVTTEISNLMSFEVHDPHQMVLIKANGEMNEEVTDE
jgi:DNA-binding transcriptional ArsR family regulator